MNVVTLNPETQLSHIRPREVIQPRFFQINNPVAIQTNQMVMLVDFGIKAGSGAVMTCFGYKSEHNEVAQDAIDRHPRNLREPDFYLCINGVRCRVILAVENCLNHRHPLRGDRQSARAVDTFKLLHALLFLCRGH